MLFALLTSPYAWLICIGLGFLLFGKRFGRLLGIPEWATFTLGERRWDLPFIVLCSVAAGFLLGRLTQPVVTSSAVLEPSVPQGWEVSRIIGNNSLRVLIEGSERTVLLVGIDELSSNSPQFEQARDALRKLVEGRRVTLEFPDGVATPDRHNRLQATIYADGVNINAEMRKLGW